MLRDLRFDLAFAAPQLDGHITFSLDSKKVACHTDGELIVYQIIEDISHITLKVIARIKTDVYKTFDKHNNLITPFDLKFLPDNRHVVLHITEGTFGVWDITSTKRIAMHTFNDAHGSGFGQFAVGSTNAGDLLLITHCDNAPYKISFRNAFTADSIRVIECKGGVIRGIVGTLDGRAIASYQIMGGIKFIDVEAGQVLHEFLNEIPFSEARYDKERADYFTNLEQDDDFMEDAQTRSRQEGITIEDVMEEDFSDFRDHYDLDSISDCSGEIAITTDGTLVAVISPAREDGTMLRVWDTHTGRLFQEIALSLPDKGYRDNGSGMMFLDDNHLFLNNLSAQWPSSSDLQEFEQKPWIVDLATKEIHEHSIRGYYPAVSPDGRYLCVWNHGRVELWRITHASSDDTIV